MQNKIRKHFDVIVRNIDADDHIDFLYSKEALEMQDYERIRVQQTSLDKSRELLLTLMRKKNLLWVNVFVESLGNCTATRDLVSTLKDIN